MLASGRKPTRIKLYTVINGVKSIVFNNTSYTPVSINIQVFTNDASLLELQHSGAKMEEIK